MKLSYFISLLEDIEKGEKTIADVIEILEHETIYYKGKTGEQLLKLTFEVEE